MAKLSFIGELVSLQSTNRSALYTRAAIEEKFPSCLVQSRQISLKDFDGKDCT